MAYTQDNRHIAITTPLGKDVLLLKGFSGHEAMSRLFSFDVELLSEVNPAVDFDSIVGKRVTMQVHHPGGTRYINGLVRRFSQGAGDRSFASYRAEVVPWLWLLTQTADCRIFQNMTVPDIIKKIFTDLGFTDFKFNLVGSFPQREYCVQYRETDFNFVSRLMEQYGIFYFFEHSDGKHVLVLGNTPDAELACDPASATFHGATGATVGPDDVVTEFTMEQEVRPAKYTLNDYNFETPSGNLVASVGSVYPALVGTSLEIYDYPGDYQKRGDGDALVKLRIEEEETQRSVLRGGGGCRQFAPGYKFQLNGHARSALDASYVLESVSHFAAERGYDVGGSDGDFSYSNTFTCIPSKVPYRPARVTPKPIVQGSQTAEVVGPKGEEIYTDKHGRVKVQFHWDREGKKDENSSCWIRVSHPWAGKGWGSVSIPRIGQEVVIDFLEGDPDQPIITGRVYNGELMPPYGLPAGGVVSGLKSNSTKGGGGYNELSMNDTKGTEMITLHGQYDMGSTIEHDLTAKVGNNKSETVGVNETLSVGTNRTRSVGSNESVTVGSMRTHNVGINESINVGAAQEITIGGLQTVTVGAVRTVTVGASQSVTVGMNHTVNVGSKQTVNIGSDEKIQIGGNLSEKIGGNHTEDVAKDRTVNIAGKEILKSGKTITVEASDEIVLQTGSAKIVMKKNGDITISGKKIEVKGTQAIEEETANMTLKASAVNTIQGNLVKIN